MDVLVVLGAPSLALSNTFIVPEFVRLTQRRTRIPYGDGHPLQGMDVFVPDEDPRGLLFFVHGGAWGSGLPWMYRLVATPFLQMGLAVAVVGYRTFPDGLVEDQVADLETAATELAKRYPHLCCEGAELGVCVMGHSSGAHIAMQMVVNRIQQTLHTIRKNGDLEVLKRQQMRIDTFVGVSAPYDITKHYEFETRRGVEELSPMKPACHSIDQFDDFSPLQQLRNVVASCTAPERWQLQSTFPRVALVHGMCDDTVPPSSSSEAAQHLRFTGFNRCSEIYFADAGHSDTVLHLMLGGETRDVLTGWMDDSNRQPERLSKEAASTQDEQISEPSKPSAILHFQNQAKSNKRSASTSESRPAAPTSNILHFL